MPLRPFPALPNVGTDICHIPRIKSLFLKLNKQNDGKFGPGHDRFLRRLFTDFELRLFWKWHETIRSVPVPAQLNRTAQYIASRWAAKEAVIKAHSNRRLSFEDIVIAKREHGAPFAIVLDQPWPKLQFNHDSSRVKPTEEGRKVQEGISPNGLPLLTVIHEKGKNFDEDRNNRAESTVAPGEQKSAAMPTGTEATSSTESTIRPDPDSITGQVLPLSISHDGEYVIATCLWLPNDGRLS